MSRFLVAIAYKLALSPLYNRLKGFARTLVEDPQSGLKKSFDLFMVFVVVSSILLLIQEVKNDLPEWLLFYNYIVVTIIFIVEYIIRFWIYNDVHKLIIKEHEKANFTSKKVAFFPLIWKIISLKWEYVKTPAAIIDLLAIIPSYRPLRVLRVFLLFRVMKLLRYTKSIQSFLSVIYVKKFELVTLLILLAFVVFISAVLIYVFEGNGQNPAISDFFDAIYWSLVTISTVGYGDITPVSIEGRVVSMIVIIAGIGILSFATSIIVSAFTEKLDELKSGRTIESVQKMNRFYLICGYSTIAAMVALRLKNEGFKMVVIDKDPVRVVAAEKDGFQAVNANASSLETYNNLEIFDESKIIAALCLITDEIQNVYITLTLKSLSQKIRIFTHAQNRNLVNKLKRAGADHVIYAYESIGEMAKEYVGQPIAFDALNMMVVGHEEAVVSEVTLERRDMPIGKSLEKVNFLALGLILLGVKRKGDFIFNPSNSFVFKDNDVLIVVGKVDNLGYLKEAIAFKLGRKS